MFDGVARLTFPMPVGPKHVHCYLLEAPEGLVLVDTGMGLPDLAERWQGLLPALERPVCAVVVTHMHPDHVGGGADVAAATGAPVYQGAVDYAQCERVWGSDDWPERIVAWFLEHGVPVDVAEQLLEVGAGYRHFIRYVRHPHLLYEDDELYGWRVGEFPGHADGHLCLLRDGVMIAGDHLLPTITPAVGLYPESRPDPLGDYLDSLERTAVLAPRVALPGHGEPIDDPAGRARAIVAHHRERLDATQALLSPRPQTAYELSLGLFPGDRGPSHRRFAVAETLSHLERLVVENRARRGEDDGTRTYTATS
jgi:glyoxylase-like metal-dependent hydrolase (beta-lactamase superfamily II)